MSNFFHSLAASAAAAPDGIFLERPGLDPVRYGETIALSARIATMLRNAGARPGARVMAQVEKSAEAIALYLATLRIGAIYAPLNTAYTKEELAYFIADAEPAVVIADPARADDVRDAGARSLLTLDAGGRGGLSEALPPADDRVEPRADDDVAVILYTSGTTGRSKGAMISHRNLASNAIALTRLWAFCGEDRLVHALPIFHIHGLFVALHTAMLSGASVVFLPKFEPAAVRRALRGASVFMGVPTMYQRLLADPDFNAEDCRAMRLFISGSAPLAAEAHRAFEARTGFAILERYGMSEAGMIASNPLLGARIAGTVGYPLPGVSLRVVDEAGAIVPQGMAGVVEIKGEAVFKGYWRQPEKTAADLSEDGWFRTGDVGALGPDGRLSLVGRAKDLIIAGGYNIYPAEIEAALDALSGVAESAVVGAPHPDMGEGVVAALVPASGSPAAPPLSDEALARGVEGLAKFKRPRKFVWVEALPRNAMGKVQKAALRERFKDAFAPKQSD